MMLGFGKCIKCSGILDNFGAKSYSLCCPPPKPGGCGPGRNKRLPQSYKSSCKPQPVAPNPCVPRFHHGGDTWKKYRFLSIFICIPVILLQAFRALTQNHPHKTPCRDYEYMRMRTKKYPWGSGNETYFHNEHVNHVAGECEPPPPVCEDDAE